MDQSPLSLLTVVSSILLGCLNSYTNPFVAAISITEATVQDIQTAFKQNQLTSRQLVTFYLHEIGKLDPILKGVIEVNPDAFYLATRLIKKGRPRSLVRVMGVILKDNIGTKDRLNTTAGSFALLGSVVFQDAGVVKKLRKVGAIVLDKTSLSEWAKFRSLTAPNGWSARGGQGKTDRFLNFINSENLPALYWIGRPICRTVSDAVHFLDAVVGFDYDDAEANGAAVEYIPVSGYTQFLNANGLKGKRLGIVRDPFFQVH